MLRARVQLTMACGCFVQSDWTCVIVSRTLAGSTMCSVCATGKYGDMAGQSACKACAPAKYSATVGSVSCTVCPSGKFGDMAGQTACRDCAPAKYSATVGSVSCTDCPSGKSSVAGSVSCEDAASGGSGKCAPGMLRVSRVGNVCSGRGIVMCTNCCCCWCKRYT